MNWMFLSILFSIAALILAVGYLFAEKHPQFFEIAAPICFAACAFAWGVFSFGTVRAEKQVESFVNQKAYIEARAESEGLSVRKMDLNEWLRDAQRKKAQFGEWTFYDDSIFCLDPIK